MFLPDRYIKGTCPKCGAKDQYGDACENLRLDLRADRPRSTRTRRSPARSRSCAASEHLFFRLSDARGRRVPASAGRPRRRPARRCSPRCSTRCRSGWATDGKRLADWDISRDAPYFGIAIPDAPGKYFYVWLDAPIGYLASLKSAPRAAQGDRLRARSSQRPGGRAVSLHRQGHRLLPHAVLAGDAGIRRQPLQPPDQRLRARLHHALRREDVEVARHRHLARSATSTSGSIPSGCATTSRPSSTRASRTSTSIPTTSSRASTATWSASTSTSRAAPRPSSRATSTARCAHARPRFRNAPGRATDAGADGSAMLARATTRRASSARWCARRCASPTASTRRFDARAAVARSRRTPVAARAAAGPSARRRCRVSARCRYCSRQSLPAARHAGRARTVRPPRDFSWERRVEGCRCAIKPYRHLMTRDRPEAGRRAARRIRAGRRRRGGRRARGSAAASRQYAARAPRQADHRQPAPARRAPHDHHRRFRRRSTCASRASSRPKPSTAPTSCSS